jgi:hypothetical protein
MGSWSTRLWSTQVKFRCRRIVGYVVAWHGIGRSLCFALCALRVHFGFRRVGGIGGLYVGGFEQWRFLKERGLSSGYHAVGLYHKLVYKIWFSLLALCILLLNPTPLLVCCFCCRSSIRLATRILDARVGLRRSH